MSGPEAPVDLIIEGNKRLTTVRILGALDASTCRVLRDSILELSAGGRNRVRVDLQQVPFLDTSGAGVLVGLRTTLRSRGGDLEVVDPQPDVLMVLERLHLDRELLEP